MEILITYKDTNGNNTYSFSYDNVIETVEKVREMEKEGCKIYSVIKIEKYKEIKWRG